jgi:hypothetical protein
VSARRGDSTLRKVNTRREARGEIEPVNDWREDKSSTNPRVPPLPGAHGSGGARIAIATAGLANRLAKRLTRKQLTAIGTTRLTTYVSN